MTSLYRIIKCIFTLLSHYYIKYNNKFCAFRLWGGVWGWGNRRFSPIEYRQEKSLSVQCTKFNNNVIARRSAVAVFRVCLGRSANERAIDRGKAVNDGLRIRAIRPKNKVCVWANKIVYHFERTFIFFPEISFGRTSTNL